MASTTDLKIKIAELEAALANRERELTTTRKELEEYKAQLDVLHQFDRELSNSDKLDHLLDHVVEWTRARTRSDFALIAKWDSRTERFEVMATNGFAIQFDWHPGDRLRLPPYLSPKEAVSLQDTAVLFDPNSPILVAELRHRDGDLIGVLMLQRHSNFPFSADDQKFARLISDKLATAMHLTGLARRIQSLGERRQHLLRMLSHDLRQPLTVLMGYVQLTKHAANNERWNSIPEYVEQIVMGAKDFNDLLEEVILMERIADNPAAQWETVSLKTTTQDAINKNTPLADLHHHTVEVELPDSDANCRGVGLELKEAASNLINNAIKYTPDGGQIKIRLVYHNEGWEFTVKDNGYGISHERQSQLFESFYRAQQPGTEDIKGSGLGLNLVKAIIERHQGKVFYTTIEGEGSTFGFWIPAD